MIYITGDTHGNFSRFTKKQRMRLPFELTKEDIVIICGDFGLLWAKDNMYHYQLKWLSELPFLILWVQGNHENYDIIAEYELERWNGGKVRHILRDKIILLERGQIFHIAGKTFFTFGGASSHDIQGGILEKDSPTYKFDKKRATQIGLPYRVNHFSWWKQELPTEEELKEGRDNLQRSGYQVDYVISHCASNRLQDRLERYNLYIDSDIEFYKHDILTDYFEELEDRLQYKHWFCGHYHKDIELDERHSILYEKIVPLDDF